MSEIPRESQLEQYREVQWRAMMDDLATLSVIESPSEGEAGVAAFLEQRLTEFGLTAERDQAGNVWVKSEAPEGEILLVAHMDKVGSGAVLSSTETEVIGRLDDALGMTVALDVLRAGQRPSVVFTVQEESEREVIDEQGGRRMEGRLKPGAVWNAGARQVVDDLFEQDKRPRLAINVDVTTKTKPGSGAAVYTSSNPPGPAGFPYPTGPIKDAAHILSAAGLSATFVEGGANDSIEFLFLPVVGVLSVEVPITDEHTDHESARRTDIESARAVVGALIEHHDQFTSDLGRRMSRSNSNIPLGSGQGE